VLLTTTTDPDDIGFMLKAAASGVARGSWCCPPTRGHGAPTRGGNLASREFTGEVSLSPVKCTVIQHHSHMINRVAGSHSWCAPFGHASCLATPARLISAEPPREHVNIERARHRHDDSDVHHGLSGG
jgi:hypothetical protein